jgi:hypothetical protein
MIAGDKKATTKQDENGIRWGCRDLWIDNPTGTIPTTCPAGDPVELRIRFPQCWDGVHLDSPDHQSHMAYPIYSNTLGASKCPPTHPVTLPAIDEKFHYPVTSHSPPAYWRLSSDMYSKSLSGGLSAHADWMNGWDAATMKTIVTQCLNKAVDCGVGALGTGVELY